MPNNWIIMSQVWCITILLAMNATDSQLDSSSPTTCPGHHIIISSICNKARQVLGLLYRRFCSCTNPDALKQLYLSLVRPHLEYACLIWDPHLVKDKTSWKECKNLASGLLCTSGTVTTKICLSCFKVSTLEEWRIELKLGLLFKIVHNLCHFPNPPELRGCRSNLRYPHALQLKLPLAHTSAYHYSFFPHTMSAWNSLDNPYIASTNYVASMKHLRTN